MSLETRSLPALYNGVSQQPPTLRADSQLEAQVNILGTVAEGLRKRPPTEHVAQLSGTSFGNAYVHTINRSATQRFIVVITNGDLQVFNQAGNSVTVNFPLLKAYLTAADPLNDFRMVTIGDYSFIVNKTVSVATETAAGTQPTELSDWYTPNQWGEDTILPPERFFNVAQGTYQGVKQSFNDLPNPADASPPSEGDVWAIRSGTLEGEDFGTYYVVRRGGAWEETYEPLGGSLQFDDDTMPWALAYNPTLNQFTCVPFSWTVRQVGDDETNSPPSFVGKNIQDVFYFKNRLGFMTDEAVVFSGAGDYANFWRNTVVDLIDSDRIDVGVSGTKTPNLEYAVPVNNKLMLFGRSVQFSLNVDRTLTASTVSLDPVTSYEMNYRARPVVLGTDAYFPVESGNYSRVREYFVSEEGNQTEAADVTAHCTQFVPKSIFDIAGNTNEDILYLCSDLAGEENRIYIYKFHWQGEQKVQSSWSYWELDSSETILNIATLAETLYVLTERSDGVWLHSLNVQAGQTPSAVNFQVYLDRRTEITGVWNGSVTTFTLPYAVPAGDARTNFRLVKGADFTGEVGSLIDPSTYTWASNTSITVPVNEADGEVYAGVLYNSSFQFSEQFMKNGDGTSVTTGRLQMRTMTIYYTDTAYFETVVDPYGTGTYAQVEEIVPANLDAFTGKTVGDESLITGVPNFDTGDFDFQIWGNSKDADITIQNMEHVGFTIQSAEWEGEYWNRAKAG
jgi:hypothetical protein